MSIFRGIVSHHHLLSYLFACLWLMPAVAGLAQTASAADSETLPKSGILELDQAVATALAHNAELAALQARLDAIRAVPSQAGALPDPVLSLSVMNLPTDTFNFEQDPMTQIQVALSQSLPYPGKRKLRQKAVAYQVEASDSMLAEGNIAKIAEVRVAWWQLMQLDLALQIVGQNKDLMRGFVNIAQTKYKVGNGLQQDVLLAQLELSRLLDRELQLQGQRRGTRAELNALMNRPSDRTITMPALPHNTALPELATETTLLQKAGTGRTLIDVHRHLVEAARADLELARKDRYPDLKIGVAYGFRQSHDPIRNTGRPDLLSVMLSINLPIYSTAKQSKAVEQRVHEVSRREFMLHDTLRNVEASVSRHFANYHAARSQTVLLETAIIPQAQLTVSSMLAGYRVNEVDFLNLVSTQITLYNAQINYWESLSKAKQALAMLASAIGEDALYE